MTNLLMLEAAAQIAARAHRYRRASRHAVHAGATRLRVSPARSTTTR